MTLLWPNFFNILISLYTFYFVILSFKIYLFIHLIATYFPVKRWIPKQTFPNAPFPNVFPIL